MFWLLFGAFLYLLIKNQFDMRGVKKDARKIAKAIMKALQGAGKTIHNAVDEAKKQKAEKAKTIKNRNLERAKKLGIEFLKENMPY